MVLLLAGIPVVGAYGALAWWEQRSVDHAARLLDRG